MLSFEPKGIIKKFGREYLEYDQVSGTKMLPVCVDENGDKYYILPQLNYSYEVNENAFDCNYYNNMWDAITIIRDGKADTILSKENKTTGRTDVYVAKYLNASIGDKYRKEFLAEAMNVELKGYVLTLQLKSSIYEEYPGIFSEPVADRYLAKDDLLVNSKENAIIYNNFEIPDAYKNDIYRKAKYLYYTEEEEPKTICGELRRLEYIVQTLYTARNIFRYLSPNVSFIPAQYCVFKENKETEKEKK